MQENVILFSTIIQNGNKTLGVVLMCKVILGGKLMIRMLL